MADSSIIVGLAKTGTTGQYKLIKQIFRDRFGDVIGVFEPTRRALMKSLAGAAQRGEPVVTKIMMAREQELLVPYKAFSKRIMVVRDPRDMVVSFLLFRPMLLAKTLPADQLERRFNRFLDAVRARVNGGNQSVFAMHELANGLRAGGVNWHRIGDLMERQMHLTATNGFYVSTYEDFVNGTVGGLLDYLGATPGAQPAETGIAADKDGSDWLSHISRSGRSGEWRNWMTREDIDFFRPLFARYMAHFGYDDDWDTTGAGEIDPRTTVEYLEKKFAQLTAQFQTFQNASDDGQIATSDLPLITRKADDGDVRCMRNLIRYHAARGPEGQAEAAMWRRKAAVLGETVVD